MKVSGRGGLRILVQGLVVKTYVGVVNVCLLDILDVILDVCHGRDEKKAMNDSSSRVGKAGLSGSNETALDHVDREIRAPLYVLQTYHSYSLHTLRILCCGELAFLA